MVEKKHIIYIVIIVILLLIFLGKPNEFSFGGAKWSFENSNNEIITS